MFISTTCVPPIMAGKERADVRMEASGRQEFQIWVIAVPAVFSITLMLFKHALAYKLFEYV